MKFTLSRRSYTFALLAALCVFGAQNSHGQELYQDKTSSVRPGTGLNRIFSSSNTYGPLGAARKVASADNLMLFWSEPPSSAQQGTTPGDAFHFQFMTYLQGQPSLPSNQRLAINDSLVGDSVADVATGTKYPAIDGSKWSVALAGDMNGDGNAQAVAVWETANQQIFATAQPVNKSNLSFQNSSVTGNLVGQVDQTPSQFDGLIHARLADLNGDGHHELVIAYDGASDGKVHIAVYGYSAASASHLALITQISDLSVYTSPAQYYQLIALATGDFNGNGHDDIAVAGFKNDGTLYIRLFSLSGGTTLVADGEKDLSTSNQPSSYSPMQLLMSAGDFTGSGSFGLVLAMNDGSNAAVYIASVDSALDTISVSFDSSYASFAVNQGAGISLDCGDLNATGKEQIVLGAQNEVFVLAAQPNGSYFLPVQKSNTYVTGASDNSDYLYSTSFVKVGDVDEDSHADIVVLRNLYNDNGTTALQEMVVNVLGSTDTSYDLSVKATIPAYMPEYTSDNPDWRRHFDLALCDINGGLKLGIPTHYYETNIVQPLVILNAPPVQFDVFNDTSYDICDVFNGGKNAGTFVTTYNQSTTNTDMMETNVTSSWGVGASLSGSASYLGAKVEASLDTHYGQDFSKDQNSSYTNTVTVNVGAQQEDEIYAIVDNYDLWEYPVLDSGQVRGHVLVTVPSPPQGEWFDTESWTAYSFVPDHVVGNVLSYLTYDSLAGNPYMMKKIKGSLSDGFQLGTGNFSWSLTTSDFQSSNVSETETFKLNVSATATVGGDFGGIGASVSAGVSGDYSNSNLTSHTSSVTSTLGLTVNLGPINQSLGEDQYTVTPYSYWGDNGALVIDYAVQPVLSAPGGTETWWQQRYGHAPDPALALPYRYWPQEGFAVQDPEKIYQTKEIFSAPSNPAPGDTVTTTVRVHNYSLIPTDTTVQVSFYVGNPANGGTIIKSLTGDSVFSTPSYIPSRGSQILTFQWIAPSTVNARLIHSGDFVHIWADVDPQHTMTEIHNGNNMGWSILEVPGIVTSVEGKAQVPAAYSLSQNYPNPFNPTTVISYKLSALSNVTLKVYDIIGREVATLVNGQQNAGAYNVEFNASRYASGVYFYRLVAEAGNGQRFVSVRKLVLMK